MIKLSILVPTVPSRIELFYVKLMKELLRQIEPYKNQRNGIPTVGMRQVYFFTTLKETPQ